MPWYHADYYEDDRLTGYCGETTLETEFYVHRFWMNNVKRVMIVACAQGKNKKEAFTLIKNRADHMRNANIFT